MAAERPGRDWEQLFAQSGVAQAIVSRDGLLTDVNAATCAMFARTPDELVGQPLLPRIPEQWREDDRRLLQDVVDGALAGAQLERRLPHPLGGFVDTVVSVVGVVVGEEVDELLVSIQDVTALKEAQLLAEQAEARWRSLSQNASDVALITDDTFVIGYVSPALTAMLGHEDGAVLNSSLLDLAHVEDRARLRATMRRLVTEKRSDGTIEYRIRDAQGDWRHIEQRAVNLLGDPHVNGLVVNLRDRTAQHDLETSLLRATLQDPLTGLSNRALVMDRIQQALDREHSTGMPFSVLFINVDKLKAINDAYGQNAGDDVLRRVADTLCALVSPADTVGRYGGDEFVVVLEGVDPREAEAVASRVSVGLAMQLVVDGVELHVSACVGLTHGSAGTAEAVVSAAEAALVNAKRLGRGRVSVLEEDLRGRIEATRELSAELACALSRRQLVVHYQPLTSLTSGVVMSFEALVRWDHPRHGLLGPDAFLPLADDLDLLASIDDWVLREACRTAARWCRERPVSIAVNVAPTRLTSPGFTQNVRDALHHAHLAPGLLTLEVTETAVVSDVDAAQRVLGELRSLGVRIAIDDFGTGYSSMLQLRELPFSELKIDREFVRGLPHSQDDTAICASVVDLAQRLGVQVIAEGVENEEQAAALASMGCQFGQGFLWSPAVDAGAATELMRHRVWVPADPARSRRRRLVASERADPRAVARARALHQSGASLYTVAAALNREGLRTRAGVRWHPASVARLLVSE